MQYGRCTQEEAEYATAALHASLAASVPALLRDATSRSRSPTPSLPTDDAQATLNRSMDELRDAEDATDALHRMLSTNLPSCACLCASLSSPFVAFHSQRSWSA